MRSSIGTILLLLFLAAAAFGVESPATTGPESGTPTTEEKTKKLTESLSGNSPTAITTALTGMSAKERKNLDRAVLFTALASVPPEIRHEILKDEPGLFSSLNESQQRYLRNAEMRSSRETGTPTSAQGGPGGQQPSPPTPSPSPAANPTATNTTAKPADTAKAEADNKTAKIEVEQPKEQKNSFLADTIKAKQEETDLTALAAAIAGIKQGVSAKALAEMAAQGGVSPNAIIQILNLRNMNAGSSQLAGTNSPVSGGAGSYGYGVAPSDRLLGSLEAPARAITAPKKKAEPQFLDQSYARGVAAANQEPASTEGGRVRVFEGGYGGGGFGEDGGTINLRNGLGIPSLPPASGHRGAGE